MPACRSGDIQMTCFSYSHPSGPMPIQMSMAITFIEQTLNAKPYLHISPKHCSQFMNLIRTVFLIFYLLFENIYILWMLLLNKSCFHNAVLAMLNDWINEHFEQERKGELCCFFRITCTFFSFAQNLKAFHFLINTFYPINTFVYVCSCKYTNQAVKKWTQVHRPLSVLIIRNTTVSEERRTNFCSY